MGSSHSSHPPEDEEDEEEEEEEEDEHDQGRRTLTIQNPNKEKVLEQEPEFLPCHASASPLSAAATPLGGPHHHPIKVWDPCNVLSFYGDSSGAASAPFSDPVTAEVVLVTHGESAVSLRPDLVTGRWPAAGLTGNGERQGRALAVFLNSQGVRFSAVYSSPLDRARSTAGFVCRELCVDEDLRKNHIFWVLLIDMLTLNLNMSHKQTRKMAVGYCIEFTRELELGPALNLSQACTVNIQDLAPNFDSKHVQELGFVAEQIQSSDALVEMSQGQWEGCLRSEIYTPEMLNLIDRTQPDFSAPSGESLRQVEFRMVEFLNRTALRLQDKLISGDGSMNHNEAKGGFSRNSSANSVQDRDGPQWDLMYRLNRPGLQRKKSGKSRLQFVTTGDNETEEDFSPREVSNGHSLHEPSSRSSVTSIGIFTHSTPIKCLLAGLFGSSPAVADRFCVDDSSVTVLQHSLRTGWRLKRLNDTSHLRLL